MTLSTVTSSTRAFKVGACWGLGHSIGMTLVAVLFVVLHRVVHLSVDAWEYYGNYCVGGSMIICALYFIVREPMLLKKQADGTYTAQPCACHGPLPEPLGVPRAHGHVDGPCTSCHK